MAEDALPRIAESTQQTAFAVEESYFALEGIAETLKQSLQATTELWATMTEMFEFQRAEAIRDSLADDGDVGTSGATGSGELDDDEDSGGEIPWAKIATGFLAALTLDDMGLRNAVMGSVAFRRIGQAITNAMTGIFNSQRFTRVVDAFRAGVSAVRNVIANAGKMIRGVAKTFSIIWRPITSVFRSMVGVFSRIGQLAGPFGGILRTVGRLFPFVTAITGIISFVSGFMDGYDEDGLMGGFREGFASLAEGFIGWPVEMLSRALAWVLEKLGFENLAEELRDIDFIQGIGDGVRQAFDFITSLFSFPEGGGALGVLSSLLDIVTLPVNLAINFVQGLFGWGDPDEPFRLSGFIGEAISSAVSWVTDKFSFVSEGLSEFSMFRFISDTIGDAVDSIRAIFSGDFSFENFSALFGSIFDIVYAPIDMAVNAIKDIFNLGDPDEPFRMTEFITGVFTGARDWLMGIFGFGEMEEDFSFTETVMSAIGAASEWMRDTISGIVESVQNGFLTFVDYLTDLPDMVMLKAREMFTLLSANLQVGFLAFGEWFASIPARIKLAALELIRSLPGGRLLVGEDDIEAARSDLENRGSDMEGRVESIMAERDAALAQIDADRRALEDARAERAAERAPIIVNNNSVVQGGDTTTTTSTALAVPGSGGGGGSLRPDMM
jgi:hypothetical protein